MGPIDHIATQNAIGFAITAINNYACDSNDLNQTTYVPETTNDTNTFWTNQNYIFINKLKLTKMKRNQESMNRKNTNTTSA
ncbi:hypothetical protein HanRHA438_Chr16g0781501 [Helianthus annuus]|nr:hypothetical protein HanRHA438_Chr16g0781501 [Helianthus annuus]